MKNIYFSIIVLSGFLNTSAQVASADNQIKDSSALQSRKTGRTYPLFKPLIISYDKGGNTDYTTDYKDDLFEEGRLKNNSRLNVTASFPLYIKKKLIVAGTISYLHQEFGSADVKNYNSLSHKESFSVDNFTGSINAIYRNVLFNKPVVYNAGIILSSRDFTSVQKVRGLLGATLIMKQTPTTVISTGLIAFVDPSVQFPVFPTLSYWHKFNENWQFDGLLPAKLLFRRSNTFGGWLSLGTEFTGTSFFNQDGITSLPGDYEFTTSEIRAGVTYEYPLNKYVLAGIKTGYKQQIIFYILPTAIESSPT